MDAELLNAEELTEKDLGDFARLPLCPKCLDTKFVIINKFTIHLTPPARNHFGCSKCKIRWAGCMLISIDI